MFPLRVQKNLAVVGGGRDRLPPSPGILRRHSGLRRAYLGLPKGTAHSAARSGVSRRESIEPEPEAGGADAGGVPGATVSGFVWFGVA